MPPPPPPPPLQLQHLRTQAVTRVRAARISQGMHASLASSLQVLACRMQSPASSRSSSSSLTVRARGPSAGWLAVPTGIQGGELADTKSANCARQATPSTSSHLRPRTLSMPRGLEMPQRQEEEQRPGHRAPRPLAPRWTSTTCALPSLPSSNTATLRLCPKSSSSRWRRR